MMIKENRCVMFPPFENIAELQVSKKFRKELQDRFICCLVNLLMTLKMQVYRK